MLPNQTVIIYILPLCVLVIVILFCSIVTFSKYAEWCGRLAHMTLYELPPHRPGCWRIQKLYNLPGSARLFLLCTVMVEPYLCTFGIDEVERMPSSFCGSVTFVNASKRKCTELNCSGFPPSAKANAFVFPHSPFLLALTATQTVFFNAFVVHVHLQSC